MNLIIDICPSNPRGGFMWTETNLVNRLSARGLTYLSLFLHNLSAEFCPSDPRHKSFQSKSVF